METVGDRIRQHRGDKPLANYAVQYEMDVPGLELLERCRIPWPACATAMDYTPLSREVALATGVPVPRVRRVIGPVLLDSLPRSTEQLEPVVIAACKRGI